MLVKVQQYKEPTSQTTTTNIPLTTRSFMDEYYEMIDEYSHEKNYKRDFEQADGDKLIPGNRYNNNNYYYNRQDKSNYLRDIDTNKANRYTMEIVPLVISYIISTVFHRLYR